MPFKHSEYEQETFSDVVFDEQNARRSKFHRL